MSGYAIETDIPAPRRSRYPWRELAVGESFFVPCASLARAKVMIRQTHTVGARLNLSFVCEQRTEEGVFGVRIWKTANDRSGVS